MRPVGKEWRCFLLCLPVFCALGFIGYLLGFNRGRLGEPARDALRSLPSGTSDLFTGYGERAGGPRGRAMHERRFKRSGLLGVASVAQRVAFDNVVIVISLHNGYEDVLINWVSFLRPLGYEKHFIAFAEDDASFDFLQQRWPGQVATLSVPELMSSSVDANGVLTFNSDAFLYITAVRLFYLRTLLELGYSILFSDIDYVWLKDPMQHITGNFSMYVHSDSLMDGPWSWHTEALPMVSKNLNICACFLFFRPVVGAAFMLDSWAQHLKVHGIANFQSDQVHLSNVMIAFFENEAFRPLLPPIGLLPQRAFAPGWRMGTEGRPDNLPENMEGLDNIENCTAVHANWMIGLDAKVAMLRKHGLWKVGDDNRDSLAPVVAKQMIDDASLTAIREAAKVVAVEGHVIFCFVTMETLRLFQNWATWQSTIGLSKFFIAITSSEAVSSVLQQRWGSIVIVVKGDGITGADSETQLHSLLPYLFKCILELGMKGIYSDVRSVWLNSPIQLLKESASFDALVMVDRGNITSMEGGGNPSGTSTSQLRALDFNDSENMDLGLLVISPSPTGLRLVVAWKQQLMMTLQMSPYVVRQSIVDAVGHLLSQNAPLNLGLLPEKLFLPGWLIFHDGQWNKEKRNTVLVVGNGWEEDAEKIANLKSVNLWLV